MRIVTALQIGLILLAGGVFAQDAPIVRLPDIGAEEPAGPPPPSTTTVAPAEEVPPPKSAAPNGLTNYLSPYWAEPDLLQTWWDPLEGNIELGMNGTDGNQETFNIRLGANAKYKAETTNHSAQLVYIEKTANGASTARSLLQDSRIEWPWEGSPWNYFVHTLVEYDEFKAFDWRLSGDTGFGYEFIQSDTTTLLGRAGLSASREIGGPDDKINPELLFGGEFKHKFNETHSISFKADYYPTITNFTDFRLNSQAAWEMVLSSELGLSLKLAVIDRYDSTPHSAKPNDLDYSTLLIWAF